MGITSTASSRGSACPTTSHGDLLAPDSDGQLRAMRAAYEQAGWTPADVDLIECHATGTPRGDAVEVESLKALWGEGGWRTGQCAIGSVKANIGHALTAAGAAGLLKVLLAMKHRTLPPTANFERPSPQLGLDASPFRVLTRAEPWPARDPGRPRRAAISGFGFGGINAHVLIEEFVPAGRARSVRHPSPAAHEPAPIAIVGIAAQVGCSARPRRSRRPRLRAGGGFGRSSHPIARAARRPVPHPADGAGRDAAAAIADAPGRVRGDRGGLLERRSGRYAPAS